MLITVDTSKDSPDEMRYAAALILSLVGDIDPSAGTEPTLTSTAPIPPPPPPSASVPIPPPPPVPSVETGAASTSATPDTSSSAAPVSVPTPPTAAVSSAPPTAPVPSAPPAATSAATSHFERDSANMPWDERIHQKGKSKKKDGTWKLKKGIDPAIVSAVVKELAASVMTVGAAPAAAPAAPPVSLPDTGTAGNVPVPPPAVPQSVPAPPVAASVPVPPAPPVGDVPAGLSFRSLVDSIVAGTKSGKLTAERVAQICQQHGAPNLASLNQPAFVALIPDVNASIEAELLNVSV